MRLGTLDLLLGAVIALALVLAASGIDAAAHSVRLRTAEWTCTREHTDRELVRVPVDESGATVAHVRLVPVCDTYARRR